MAFKMCKVSKRHSRFKIIHESQLNTDTWSRKVVLFCCVNIFFSSFNVYCQLYNETTESQPKFKVYPAATISEVRDVFLYEATSMLIFRIELPTPVFQNGSMCATNKTEDAFECVVNSTISLLHNDYQNQIMEYLAHHESEKRVERAHPALIPAAIFGGIGFLAGVGGSKVFDWMFGSDTKYVEYYNKLRDSLAEEDKRIGMMEVELEHYTKSNNEAIRKIEDRLNEAMKTGSKIQNQIDKNFRSLIILIRFKQEYDWHQELLHTCERGTLSTRHVSFDRRLQALTTLEKELIAAGKKLVIPLTKINLYDKRRIWDCMFGENFIIIMGSIPTARLQSNWKLHHLMPHKFAYNGQTCELYPFESKYLATSGDRAILITNELLETCDLKKSKLCRIPQYQRDSDKSLACAMAIFQDKSIEELFKSCSYRCSSNNEISIAEIDDNHILVTNAESLIVTCPNGTSIYGLEKFGATEITLQCNCTMVINGNVVLDEPYYCLRSFEKVQNETIYRVVPNLWTQLNESYENYRKNYRTYENISINENWHTQMPILNLSKPQISIPDHLYVGVSQFTFILTVAIFGIIIGILFAALLFVLVIIKRT